MVRRAVSTDSQTIPPSRIRQQAVISRWVRPGPSPQPEDAGAVEQVEPESAGAPADSPEPGAASIEVPDAAEPCAAVMAANGHDNGDGLDIPEFLRNV